FSNRFIHRSLNICLRLAATVSTSMFEVLSIPPLCSPLHFTTRLPPKRSERGSKKREGRIVTIDISLALIVFYEYSLKRLLYKADQLFPQLYPKCVCQGDLYGRVNRQSAILLSSGGS